jgi:hypothetical protein
MQHEAEEQEPFQDRRYQWYAKQFIGQTHWPGLHNNHTLTVVPFQITVLVISTQPDSMSSRS